MTKKILFWLLVGQLLLAGCQVKERNNIRLAAASDLKFAMDSLISLFLQQHPTADIVVTYGSSGKLYEQILNHAPYDLFFSADLSYPRQLQEKGRTRTPVKLYSTGRVVIWSKKLDPNLNGMNSLLDSTIIKIAIANPDHAPYGKRAMESLIYYKLHDQVKEKLVYGENISHTAQFITTGAADIGIIALSLAISPVMQKAGGQYYLIPDASHQPLQQGFVVLNNEKANIMAITFSDFITSSAAREVLAHFGFSTSDE